jgi:hypothetical protein
MSTDTDRLEEFLSLSAVLTAFTEFDLHGTGQAEAYLATVVAAVGPRNVDELLAAHGAVREAAAGDDSVRDPLLRSRILSDERLGPIARNLMKLWYIGTWYAMPQEWAQAFGVGGTDGTFVVSRTSYAEGLVWPAIGANPPGAKGPGYGTWAEPPTIALT